MRARPLVGERAGDAAIRARGLACEYGRAERHSASSAAQLAPLPFPAALYYIVAINAGLSSNTQLLAALSALSALRSSHIALRTVSRLAFRRLLLAVCLSLSL